MVKNNTIIVGADLSEDLQKIFQKHHFKTTDEQRIFWSEQCKALGKQDNPQTMRWNPFVIRVALHLQMVSRSAYEYLGHFIKLPSQRRLYDYTHFIESKKGPQEKIIANVKKNIENVRGLHHETYFNLIFDEMYIRSNIVICKKTGEILGYVYLNKVEEEIAKLEAEVSGKSFERQPAKTVLVFMLQGITDDTQEVIGIYPCDTLKASQLHSRCWDLISLCEESNLKIIALIYVMGHL